jgi:hypothetical protein
MPPIGQNQGSPGPGGGPGGLGFPGPGGLGGDMESFLCGTSNLGNLKFFGEGVSAPSNADTACKSRASC